MGRTIQVTSAQVNAARLWIERADRDGTQVPEAIRKLAQAKPRPIISDPTTLVQPATPGNYRGGADQSAADDSPVWPDPC